jgi:hypothetical protein
MMDWKPDKLQSQNRRALFDVEVHKSFVSTASLSIIHRGCTFFLSYPYWLKHHDRAQININSDKNITQSLLFSVQTIIS